MSVEETIKKYENQIAELDEVTKKCYEAKINIYCELRKIMEEEKNHKDKFIINELNPEKDNEYRRLLSEYKEKDEEFNKKKKENEEKIQEHFKKILEYKEKQLTVEKTKEDPEKHKYEVKKRTLLEKAMNIISEKDINKEIFKRVQEIYKNNTNTNE